MKVGLVSAFPPGHNSLNEYGLHLARALGQNPDVDEVVVFADKNGGADDGSDVSLARVTVRPTWGFNRLTTAITLPRAIKAANVDAVLFNLQFASFGDTRIAGGLGLLSPAIARAIGVPTGVILHNLVENVDMKDAGFASSNAVARLLKLAGTTLTRMILRADYVSLTIPRYVELIRERYGATNAILTPHGSFEDSPTPSFDIPGGRRKLLAFGKWGTYKKVEMFLDAYQILLDRGYEDLEVIIAGPDTNNAPGYLAEVQRQYQDLPHVTFTGYVAEQDVPSLFGDASAVVFPYTSTTGSSGVLHQAGSYGRATVLPCIGDFLEVIEEEGFQGEYFTPNDPESLADAIANIIDDPVRRVEMGRLNFAASAGIALTDVADWHVIHLEKLVAA